MSVHLGYSLSRKEKEKERSTVNELVAQLAWPKLLRLECEVDVGDLILHNLSPFPTKVIALQCNPIKRTEA